MLKLTLTGAVISKGFENNPAIRFISNEHGETVRFRVGKKIFDPSSNTDDKSRWININVKSGNHEIIERIKKMQLKEGSWVELSGEIRLMTWEDQTTKEQKEGWVIDLEHIDYASSGGGNRAKDNNQTQTQGQQNYAGNNAPAANNAAPATSPDPTNSPNFSGFENYSGGSFFD